MHATQPQGASSSEPRTSVTPPVPAGLTMFGAVSRDGVFSLVRADGGSKYDAPPADEPSGYLLTELGELAVEEAGATEAPGTAGAVLKSAATYLERHGWIQGAYYDATAVIFTPAADMVGAIAMACYGGPVEAPAQHFTDPGFLDFEEAVLHLDRYLLVYDGSVSYEFNDAKGRQFTDVLRVLRQAADTPVFELLDAIRAINATNKAHEALIELFNPSGVFSNQDSGAQGGDA